MSRIGKQNIKLPVGTEIAKEKNLITIKGPKGFLTRSFRNEIDINIKDNVISLVPKKKDVFSRALWGTYASHLNNMIQGVNKSFEKKLIIEGIGFKSEVKDKKLILALGFSHLINIQIPKELIVSAEKNIITINGIDKEEVGRFSAKVRALKKPEPYKGKGIRYEGEIIRRKQGKKAVS